MALRWLADAIGTAKDYWRIGLTGVRLKNNACALEIRNSADAADANIKAAVLTLSGGAPGAGKVLTSDGGGVGSWQTPTITPNADRVNVEAFTQASGTPLAIYTPAATEIVTKVIVEMTGAAGGGAPTLAVGIAGNVGLYMATTENNVKEVGVYEVQPMISNAGGTAIILTIVASAQNFAGNVYVFTSAVA